ncbi:MAG: hypothetical protein ACM3U1_07330 [Chloroflexota bacterium]
MRKLFLLILAICASASQVYAQQQQQKDFPQFWTEFQNCVLQARKDRAAELSYFASRTERMEFFIGWNSLFDPATTEIIRTVTPDSFKIKTTANLPKTTNPLYIYNLPKNVDTLFYFDVPYTNSQGERLYTVKYIFGKMNKTFKFLGAFTEDER